MINLPSLGTIHSGGYWLALLLLLWGDQVVFLNALVMSVLAVPLRGAFDRDRGRRWLWGGSVTLVLVSGWLLFATSRDGVAGLVFYWSDGPYGLPLLQINPVSFLATGLIVLPLSGACALDRLRRRSGSSPVARV